MRSLPFALLVALPILSAGCGGVDNDQDASVFSALGTRMGVDYSFGRPSPASIHAAGYTFAVRYVSDVSGKNMSLGETQALIAAGVDVVTNWEQDGHTEILNGYNSGVYAAQRGLAVADAAGMPAGRPIYFSIDFDASAAQQAAVNSFYDGAAAVLGRGRVGAYGGLGPISRLFDAGKIAYGWQTYAWSGGKWDARAQLRQVNNSAACGGSCDIDQAIAADFGQWGAAAPPNAAPAGALDTASCGGVAGWTMDPDARDTATSVTITVDGPAGAGAPLTVPAYLYRADLCTAIGSCNHGYSTPLPLSIQDGQPHTIYAYGNDASGGPSAQLQGSPKTVTCNLALPQGEEKRHIVSLDSYSAWGFSSTWDQVQVPDATLVGYPRGEDVPGSLAAVRDGTTGAIYVLDGPYKRHITDPTSLSNWHATSYTVATAAQLALLDGPALGSAPQLVRGDDGSIYMLDSSLPTVGALDGADCNGVGGWNMDPYERDAATHVQLVADGDYGAPTSWNLAAVTNRADLCTAIGSCNHGYSSLMPLSLQDNKPHTIKAYGLTALTGAPTLLSNGSRAMQCSASLPDGIKRKLSSSAVLAHWSFSPFQDQLTLDKSDVLDAHPDGANFPDAPSLLKDADSNAVFLVDGAAKRYVSADAWAAWHFDVANLVTATAAQLASLQSGPDLGARPLLVTADGGTLYLLDVLDGDVGQRVTAGSGSGPSGGAKATGNGAVSSGCTSSGSGSGSGFAGMLTVLGAALALTRRRR